MAAYVLLDALDWSGGETFLASKLFTAAFLKKKVRRSNVDRARPAHGPGIDGY
jgi:hypothetical protein